MAEVNKGDRKSYGFPDGSYPCKTSSQMHSAIDLRHNGKSHSAAAVLAHVAQYARLALKEKRISRATFDGVMNAIAEAKKKDASKKS